MKRKVAVGGIICVLVVSGLFGARYYHHRNNPITLETIGDTVPDDLSRTEKDKAAANLKIKAKSAVLIDGDTGKILFEKNAHQRRSPASVTKIMTMLLALEACKDGRISLKDKVTISETAASMGGSQMYMEPGETHTLDELLKGIAMVSANDGCVAVAEHVYGSEEIFVEHMNKRAGELGMKDTHFCNTNGLPAKGHVTSAYDIALMSKELLKHPHCEKWLTCWQDTITVGLPGKETEFGLANTNKLVRHYKGCTGIKTGFTQEAGYCLSASATREDTTMIAVAMGSESSKIRNGEVTKMLDYGFANYETKLIASKGQTMGIIKLAKGNPRNLDAVSFDKITALTAKGEKGKITCKTKLQKNIKLPVKRGETVGSLTVFCGEKQLGVYDLKASKKIEKISFIQYCIRIIKDFF